MRLFGVVIRIVIINVITVVIDVGHVLVDDTTVVNADGVIVGGCGDGVYIVVSVGVIALWLMNICEVSDVYIMYKWGVGGVWFDLLVIL